MTGVVRDPELLGALQTRLWAGQTLPVAAKALGVSYEMARGLIRRHGRGEAPAVPEPPRRGCQWISSDYRPWRFECTDPVVDGGSWCAVHRRIVYVRTPWRISAP